MVKVRVNERGFGNRLACESFSVRESGIGTNRRMMSRTKRVADWLLRLTRAHKRLGCGLWSLCISETLKGSDGTTSACTVFIENWSLIYAFNPIVEYNVIGFAVLQVFLKFYCRWHQLRLNMSNVANTNEPDLPYPTT